MRALAALVALMLGAGPAAACRLALVLALDVSSSVDAYEDGLQRQGLARALTAPEVQAAFLSGGAPVALSVFEWSGRYDQALLLDWRLIAAPRDLAAAARTLAASTRSQTKRPTAMGHALGYGAGLFARAPPCARHTIDVSGDGANNEGIRPRDAFRRFPLDGVTVNGLVIADPRGEAAQRVIDFYRDHLLHGPGAFLEIAAGFEDFETTMRRKLVREVAALQIGARHVPGGPG